MEKLKGTIVDAMRTSHDAPMHAAGRIIFKNCRDELINKDNVVVTNDDIFFRFDLVWVQLIDVTRPRKEVKSGEKEVCVGCYFVLLQSS